MLRLKRVSIASQKDLCQDSRFHAGAALVCHDTPEVAHRLVKLFDLVLVVAHCIVKPFGVYLSQGRERSEGVCDTLYLVRKMRPVVWVVGALEVQKRLTTPTTGIVIHPIPPPLSRRTSAMLMRLGLFVYLECKCVYCLTKKLILTSFV